MLLFQCNNGYANAPQCYFLRTLPVLLMLNLVVHKVITGALNGQDLVTMPCVMKTTFLLHFCYVIHSSLVKSNYRQEPLWKFWLIMVLSTLCGDSSLGVGLHLTDDHRQLSGSKCRTNSTVSGLRSCLGRNTITTAKMAACNCMCGCWDRRVRETSVAAERRVLARV